MKVIANVTKKDKKKYFFISVNVFMFALNLETMNTTTDNVAADQKIEIPAREFIPFGSKINPVIKNLLISESALQGSRNVYEVLDDALVNYLLSRGYAKDQLQIK